MRFLLLSLFFHMFLFSLVFFSFPQALQKTRSQTSHTVSLQVYTSPPTSTIRSHSNRSKTFQPKTIKKNREVRPLKLADQNKNKANEKPQSLEEQTARTTTASLNYSQELKLFIEQNKRYPKRALRLKQAGVVKVQLKISSQGVFNNIKLISPSPYVALNQAAIQLLKQLKQFKPLPQNIKPGSQFIIPIAYIMGSR